jgi:A/G-specific adenine glycosylase
VDAAVYHYGLLDLAASVCRPRRPDCRHCPIRANCKAAKTGGALLTGKEPGG